MSTPHALLGALSALRSNTTTNPAASPRLALHAAASTSARSRKRATTAAAATGDDATAQASPPLLLIIDGHHLAHRSYHAHIGQPLVGPGGEPTSITHSFIASLRRLVARHRPTSLAVVFDSGTTWRHVMSLLDPTIGPTDPASQYAAARQAAIGGDELDLNATAQKLLQRLATPPADPSTPSAAPDLEAGRAALADALGAAAAARLGVAAARPTYKVGRPPTPDAFRTDLANLQRLLACLGVAPLARPWLEADDLAGLLAAQARACGMDVLLVSGDADLLQLVAAGQEGGAGAGGAVRLLQVRTTRREELFDVDAVVSKLGLPPGQIALLKALQGDTTDTIPGVAGVGPRTAEALAPLLAEAGGLSGAEAVLRGPPGAQQLRIKTALQRKALTSLTRPDGRAAARYSLLLSTILGAPGAPDLPPGVLPAGQLQSHALRGFDPEAPRPLLRQLGLRSLERDLDDLRRELTSSSSSSGSSSGGSEAGNRPAGSDAAAAAAAGAATGAGSGFATSAQAAAAAVAPKALPALLPAVFARVSRQPAATSAAATRTVRAKETSRQQAAAGDPPPALARAGAAATATAPSRQQAAEQGIQPAVGAVPMPAAGAEAAAVAEAEAAPPPGSLLPPRRRPGIRAISSPDPAASPTRAPVAAAAKDPAVPPTPAALLRPSFFRAATPDTGGATAPVPPPYPAPGQLLYGAQVPEPVSEPPSWLQRLTQPASLSGASAAQDCVLLSFSRVDGVQRVRELVAHLMALPEGSPLLVEWQEVRPAPRTRGARGPASTAATPPQPQPLCGALPPCGLTLAWAWEWPDVASGAPCSRQLHAAHISFRGAAEGDELDAAGAAPLLAPLLSSGALRATLATVALKRFARQARARLGLPLAAPHERLFDTSAAAYVLNSEFIGDRKAATDDDPLGALPDFVAGFLGVPTRRAVVSELAAAAGMADLEEGDDGAAAAAALAGGVLHTALCYDALVGRALAADPRVAALVARVEVPVQRVLADMEVAGLRIDVEGMRALQARAERRMEQICDEVEALAGRRVDLHSTHDVGRLLYDELRLHTAAGHRPKKLKSGAYSTAAQDLEVLAAHYAAAAARAGAGAALSGKGGKGTGVGVAALILEHRSLMQLVRTYTGQFIPAADPATSRVHATFNQLGTSTGRLSCTSPNLMAVPQDSDANSAELREFRATLVAAPGWQLVAADYSQIELRLLAHLSRDPMLVRAYRDRRDLHRQTAALLYDTDPSLVTDEQRHVGKQTNFGIVYGMGAGMLADKLKGSMTREEAARHIQKFKQAYAVMDEHIARTRIAAVTCGGVRSMWGRVRPFAGKFSTPEMLRLAGRDPASISVAAFEDEVTHMSSHGSARGDDHTLLREAGNMAFQGSTADLVKAAMVRVHARLAERGLRARLVVMVHDELVLEAPDEEVAEVAALLKREMEGVCGAGCGLEVPLEVGVEAGRSWGELADVTPHIAAQPGSGGEQ